MGTSRMATAYFENASVQMNAPIPTTHTSAPRKFSSKEGVERTTACFACILVTVMTPEPFKPLPMHMLAACALSVGPLANDVRPRSASNFFLDFSGPRREALVE